MRLPLYIFIIIFSVLVWASDQTIEMIPVKYRPPQELITTIRPMLNPGASITFKDSTILLKDTPENIAAFKKVIASLDKPAKTLLISIRKNAPIVESDSHIVAQTETDTTEINQIRVLDGHSAYISTGHIVSKVRTLDTENLQMNTDPSSNKNTNTLNYNKMGLAYDTQELTSGMVVLPKLMGDHVELSLSQQKQDPSLVNQNSIQTQNLQTTIQVPLNTWVSLGGISEISSPSGGHTYSTDDKSENHVNLWIMIQQLP